jgi:hypothetical protein
MTRSLIIPVLIVGALLVWPLTASAQAAKTVTSYDRAAETTIKGTVVGVIGVNGAADLVGLHLELKTDRGIVKVHVAPTLFVADRNFWFVCDEDIEVTGVTVTHAGVTAFWARSIVKGNQTLTIRDETGIPLWKVDSGPDPDGCGVSHPAIR